MSSHAYTLVGCFEYKGNKLVKIRNPHGQGEWQGAWSDNDRNWTKDMKTKCEFGQEGDDGTFYMSLSDFHSNFGITTICKVRDNFAFQSVKVTPSEEGVWIKFTIDSSGEGHVSVIQQNP